MKAVKKFTSDIAFSFYGQKNIHSMYDYLTDGLMPLTANCLINKCLCVWHIRCFDELGLSG